MYLLNKEMWCCGIKYSLLQSKLWNLEIEKSIPNFQVYIGSGISVLGADTKWKIPYFVVTWFHIVGQVFHVEPIIIPESINWKLIPALCSLSVLVATVILFAFCVS